MIYLRTLGGHNLIKDKIIWDAIEEMKKLPDDCVI